MSENLICKLNWHNLNDVVHCCLKVNLVLSSLVIQQLKEKYDTVI